MSIPERQEPHSKVRLQNSLEQWEKPIGNWCRYIIYKSFTNPGILSTISLIYDPLCLDSPFVLERRKTVWNLSHDKSTWDHERSKYSNNEWYKGQSGIPWLLRQTIVLPTILALIKNTVKFNNIVEHYWTGSHVITGNVKNMKELFKVIVVKRV